MIKTYHRMQHAFPGKALPANVVVKAHDVTAPAVRTAIGQFERRAIASGRMFRPITVDVNRAGTVADVTIPIAGNGTDAASKAAFHLLRGTIVPETVGAVPNTESGVTGTTAGWQDSADKLKSDLLPVIAFVLLLAFALMLLAFRSVVIAAKAIVLNLLSVGAAYGVLVLVFQHGVGKNLIGASSANGIEVVVPLLLFVILFGLSMDYHVFIISRIRETFDRGANVDDAVSHGIKSTAGVVTSAAIVMVCVFSIFATLSTPFFKQFGIGLAAAILIDATVVRAVLLPASMKLLGNWNWYLPRWLEWMPRLASGELEPIDEPEPQPEPEPTTPAARKPKRRLGFARVTGLILIAIVALALGYVKVTCRRGHRFGPRRRLRRPADPASVLLRHGAGQLRRGLRHPRRPREPGQARFSADRPARDPDQGAIGSPWRSRVPAPGRPGRHQHDVPGRQPARGQP